MSEKKTKVQVFIDGDLAQQIKDALDNSTTSVSWVVTQLGKQFVRGITTIQAINPLKNDDSINK